MQAKATIQRSNSGDEYDDVLTGMVERFRELGNVPLFTTNTEGLWELYLDGFHANERQFHNCNECRHFIRKFGGLVTIGDRGAVIPAVFTETPDIKTTYGPSITAMFQAVSRAKVTGVFLCSDVTWGTPRTGDVERRVRASRNRRSICAGRREGYSLQRFRSIP